MIKIAYIISVIVYFVVILCGKKIVKDTYEAYLVDIESNRNDGWIKTVLIGYIPVINLIAIISYVIVIRGLKSNTSEVMKRVKERMK